MLNDIVALVQQAACLPEISGKHCVHALIECASCEACVQACPRQAWVLDDDGLGLIEDNCDGCGLCVPACPQQAIEHKAIQHKITVPVVRSWRSRLAVLCGCEKTGLAVDEGVIPCLHTLGLPDLLKLYNQGYRQLLLSCVECDTCPRGSAVRIQARLESINQALAQRAQPLLEYSQLTLEQWQNLYEQAPVQSSSERVSRRQFFRRSTVMAANASTQHFNDANQATLLPGQLMPTSAGPAIWPTSPVLDETACNGCDACFKLCPHNALQRHDNDYQVDPALCTGCGICVDSCDQSAITLQQWRLSMKSRVPLQQANCRACSAPFHYPAAQQASDGLCRICRTTNHYKALHQVYS